MLERLGPVIAIAVMALATYLMRAGGFWVMGHVPLTPRLRRMLQALPGSIVMAIIAPLVAKAGLVAVLAVLTAAALMILRRNEFLAVTGGLIVGVVARHAGI
ncbi:MAG TPA: AzlD domain-containing protein [Burkholderiales bacterium]|nr:AzlD domain-containing protein [Burkholderiales bacterium]